MELMKTRRNVFFLLIFSAFVTSSCVNTRQATYFNGVNDGTVIDNIPVPEQVIQKNDLLSIAVSSLSADASAPFNSPNYAAQVPGATNNITSGYLVNASGEIQFPFLGNIKAEGLTKEQLKNDIIKKILTADLLKDPILNIRFLNFRVTVLGEVKNPTVINVPSEKISLLEAIGLAGDLTLYARRDNVLVIREEAGKKVVKRIDLNSNELLNSPYYYLRSNDVVYAEPNKAGVAASNRSQQWVPAVLSGLSLVTIILDRIIK